MPCPAPPACRPRLPTAVHPDQLEQVGGIVYDGLAKSQLEGFTMEQSETGRTWTVEEAKARLFDILRLAEEEAAQRIGKRRSFIIVSDETWNAETLPLVQRPRIPLGQWLVENMPRGIDLELPSRDAPEREVPFVNSEDE